MGGIQPQSSKIARATCTTKSSSTFNRLVNVDNVQGLHAHQIHGNRMKAVENPTVSKAVATRPSRTCNPRKEMRVLKCGERLMAVPPCRRANAAIKGPSRQNRNSIDAFWKWHVSAGYVNHIHKAGCKAIRSSCLHNNSGPYTNYTWLGCNGALPIQRFLEHI